MKQKISRFLMKYSHKHWRYVHRIYWRWKFNRLNETDKRYFEMLEIDPDSLIRRGIL